MAEKILKFDTYHGALTAVTELLKNRKPDLSVRHILLVPEKDTLKCERLLFCAGGAFDIEVYSLTRWFFKLGGGRLLSRTGAVMILKDILRFLDLKCFYRSKSFSGFCALLFDTLCNFWDWQADFSAEKTPDKEFGGALGLKLYDLNLISEQFKKRAEPLCIGRAGITRLIAEKLREDNFLHNARVYAVNFDRPTLPEKSLFDLIGKNALSFVRTEVDGRPRITANTEIYKASGVINCLKAAALRIRERARAGESFSDMAVVAPALSFQQAKRIMDENGIPFYADKSKNLNQTRTAEYLNALFSLKRLRRRDFIILAKNPFSGIDRADADVFENYVNAFATDYLGFASPFSLTNPARDAACEAERLSAAESVRKKLYKAVSDFWKRLDGVGSTADFCLVIKTTLEKSCGDTPETQKIGGLLAEMQEFLGCGKGSRGEFDGDADGAFKPADVQRLIEALREGIAAETLSKLPLTQNCVIVGDAGIFKGSKIKHVFAVGFNEGVMPAPPASAGLLTEGEARSLNAAGASLPLSTELFEQKEYQLLQLFSGAETLFISYVADGEARPSPLLYTVKAEAENIVYSDLESERKRAESGDASAALSLAGSPAAALEQLILNRESKSPFIDSLASALGKKAQKYLKPPVPPKKIAQELFFGGGTVSVSQLQSYFLCPYKHFAAYGLKASARDRAEADALDIGGAAHKACELYVLSGFDSSRLTDIAENVLSGGAYAYKLNPRQKSRLKKEIISLCGAFGENIKRGVFKPLGAEIKFGRTEQGDTRLKGAEIGGLTLKGSVDYADAADGYVRIVDYKTGGASLSEREVYYGRKLQLPLYMRVMAENGFKPAALLYYIFKETRGGDRRFCGVYLSEPEILKAFDTQMQDENAVVPAKLKTLKSGEVKAYGRGACRGGDLQTYIDYACAASLLAIEQIKEGNIAPSPLKDGGFFICDYCDFSPACGGGEAREAGRAKIKTGGGENGDGEDGL